MTTPITDYLAAIEAREKETTPGPWQHFFHEKAKSHDIHRDYIVAPVEAPTGFTPTGYIAEGIHLEEAQFISHSRRDIPNLLKLARKYREALEEIHCAWGTSNTRLRRIASQAGEVLKYDPREEGKK